jgi:hypothetical protein
MIDDSNNTPKLYSSICNTEHIGKSKKGKAIPVTVHGVP